LEERVSSKDHTTSGLVNLCFYQSEHYDALKAFWLPEDQKAFTALPLEALEKCKEEKERRPVVILNGKTPVGFFVLHTGENIRPFTDNPRAVLLRALSVNYSEQGKGYAKKAMALLPAFVKAHFPDVNEIVLAVNERNLAAQKLYFAVGFIYRGLRREGRIGPQLLLHYPL
jgi:RimJ/RimL family protein N-acetyltransferase